MLCSRCKKHMAVVFRTRQENNETITEGFCIHCARELNLAPVDEMLKNMGLSAEEVEQMAGCEITEEELEEATAAMEEQFGDLDFESGGAATNDFYKKMQSMMGRMFGQNGSLPADDGSAANGLAEQNDKKKKKKKGEEEPPKRKYLDAFCENLSAKAAAGKMDQIIGREKEIYRVIQILSRRIKNNPCLIGEPGVGKTAIAEGIAQRICAGDVPQRLSEKEVYLLDFAALVAGTQFRGQFESRIKGLVSEVKQAGNVILFIDEIHNLVGAGDSEGSMSAANLLKPALSRGELQVIGATTFHEYRKYIEKDSALERRFQPVKVGEPTAAQTVEILKGIKKYYEAYHRVQISDYLLGQAVQLSQRYITDRFLPDKAIDLVDEACTAAALASKDLAAFDKAGRQVAEIEAKLEELTATAAEEGTQPDWEKHAALRTELLNAQTQVDTLKDAVEHLQVSYDQLANVIELWTGIPAAKVKETELEKVANLQDLLAQKVVAQKEAIDQVSKAVRRSRVQLSATPRPASFLFVGPTGVGKTLLAKTLAQTLFDHPDPLIRIDMSEYMEKHALSRMIGSPPGYVGYDEAGQLTEKVRRQPYSVVLFDEIEKAHPDVLNLLLQILDEGRVTDGQGRTVDFSNTVMIMTSNAGSDQKDFVVGFDKSAAAASKEKVMRALKGFLRPEFLGRVDEIVVFDPLTKEDFVQVLGLLAEELCDVLRKKGITLTLHEDALALMAKEAFDGGYGARDLRKTLRRKVEDPVADLLVKQYDNPPKALEAVVQAGEIVLIQTKEETPQ